MKAIRLFLLFTLFFFLTCFPTPAREETGGKDDELARIEEEIELTKKLLEEERSAHRQETEEAAEVLERIEQEITELAGRAAEFENEREQRKKEKEKILEDLKKLESCKRVAEEQLDEFREELIIEIPEMVRAIEEGIPYNRKIRMADFLLLKKDLEGERVTIMEGLGKFWDLLEHELALGVESEVYLGEVPGEINEMKGAKYLRLGMVCVAYVSEDGKEVGILLKDGPDYRWLSKLDKPIEEAIKEAIRVQEGKKVFSLVEFPFDFKSLEIPETIAPKGFPLQEVP